jgi:hypothetical protein
MKTVKVHKNQYPDVCNCKHSCLSACVRIIYSACDNLVYICGK